ncbi:MAG: Dabb family protein [Methanobacteriaceae archaeon]|nr:Dabb family protein [Methanobacteriaceae archaeon]
MITHIVLFKLKDRSMESLEKARNILMGMENKIPELKHIEVGVGINNSDRSYDIALLTKFESLKDLKAYQNNPLHLEVAEYVFSVEESLAVVDYESS